SRHGICPIFLVTAPLSRSSGERRWIGDWWLPDEDTDRRGELRGDHLDRSAAEQPPTKSVMSAVNLTLRWATMADAGMLVDWRNDFEARNNSRNNSLIDLNQHEEWLSRALAAPGHIIKIAEASGEPVGVVRADRSERGWELSWIVAPKARGQGIGGRMLREFVVGLDGCLA